MEAGTGWIGSPVRINWATVFAATPTPYLVLTPELVIVAANDAYLRATDRSREELVGRHLFDAFPANPDDPEGTGVANLRASLRRAREAGRPDPMGLQRYDIPTRAGGFEPRWWSPLNVPVLDDTGRVVLLLHRVQDLTDFVRRRQGSPGGEGAARRAVEAEADLLARSKELRGALAAEALATQRLAALGDVARELAACDSVDALTDIVVERGLSALGADGGSVAVRDGGRLHLTFTESLGELTRERYGELPLDGELPTSVAARTGERVLVPDRAAAVAFTGEMAGVLDTTGMRAWAALPLRVGDRLLGALSVGWREAHPFPPREIELLDTFAAQCAQTLDRIRVHQAQRRTSETLQRSLLTDPPPVAGLSIAVRYQPAAEHEQVGGDWYDAFHAADGALTVVIGDVAGHDRRALAAMAQIRSKLRGIAYVLGERPAAIFAGLERAQRGLGVSTLASALLGHIRPPGASGDPDRAHLVWCNAGHPPPVLVPRDGEPRVLATAPDPLLGVGPCGRHDHELLLERGSVLVLYTDGLVERRDATIDEGVERLRRAAARLRHRPLGEFCAALVAELAAEPGDDIALLALRVD